MTSKLTREQLHERARENVKALKMASRQTAFESAREEILADLQLAELVLAAMDGEPVAIVEPSDYVTAAQLVGEESLRKAVRELYEGALRIGDKLYRHAQPAAEREQVRSAHAEWSQETFGNVGPVGPLKHLSKEAQEAAEQPGDLSEWADMQFLLWDAQHRAGITDEQITQAMIEKLAVNKQREWPEPKDGEPRLHIKEQPAQVVPEEATPDSIEILASARRRDHAVFQWDEDQRNAAADSWNACRAAMLQEFQKSAGAEEICRNKENVQVLHTNCPVQSDCCPAQNVVAPAQSPIDHGYLPECECSGCRATARICAELSANSPANPDCWCRTCRPVVLNDMRFVVCPDCGNKRCPRANDHRNACTGSNEPGQEGSAYPDAQQEVKGE